MTNTEEIAGIWDKLSDDARRFSKTLSAHSNLIKTEALPSLFDDTDKLEKVMTELKGLKLVMLTTLRSELELKVRNHTLTPDGDMSPSKLLNTYPPNVLDEERVKLSTEFYEFVQSIKTQTQIIYSP